MATTRKAPLSRIIQGVKFPSRFPEDCIKRALQYHPRDDDTFLVTFPKCGTTWTQQILFLMFNQGNPPDNFEEFNRAVPFLDINGPEIAETLMRPIALKVHFPFHVTPYSSKAKYIYVARNPRDCCMSYYYHNKKLHLDGFLDATFDDFFELFVTGDTDYGDYFDHLLGWYEHRNDPNVLFLTYEGMKAKPGPSILKIAEFLGKEHLNKLEQDPELLKKILQFSNFEYMKTGVKQNIDKLMNMSLEELESDPFASAGYKQFVRYVQATGGRLAKVYVRKGIVGDWKNHFSPEQNRQMEERIKEKTLGSDVMTLWKDIEELQSQSHNKPI